MSLDWIDAQILKIDVELQTLEIKFIIVDEEIRESNDQITGCHDAIVQQRLQDEKTP
jgi:hypothetical protein